MTWLMVYAFAALLVGVVVGIFIERRRRSRWVRLNHTEAKALADDARDIAGRLYRLEYTGPRILQLSEVTGLLWEFADLLEAAPGWRPRTKVRPGRGPMRPEL